MLFREHRTKPRGVSDLLPWAGVIADGVLVNKQGTFSAGWSYRAPDLESSVPEELTAIAQGINRALAPLHNEWFLHIDAVRVPSMQYPEPGAFPDPVTALIDDCRREQYRAESGHFETRYVLIASWFPRTERTQKATKLFVTTATESTIPWDRELARFESGLARIETTLSPFFQMVRLDTGALLRHLHLALTGKDQPIDVPDIPFYVDEVIAGAEMYGGFEPQIGRHHCRVVSIDGYPRKSHPAICDFLHHLPATYRWNTRWMPLDRLTAEKELSAHRRNWFKSRHGIIRQFRQTEARTTAEHLEMEAWANQDKVAMYRDANMALAEASSGLVSFGFLSNTLVLMHEDERVVEDSARLAEKAIAEHGFTARVETVNALDAIMGSLPGNYTANVRRPLMHSLNLAHLIPMTSVFAGLEFNPNPMYPEASSPLFFANTTGSTPYRAHLHVSDVGHTLIVGPTGTGKSTLLAFMAASFLRYPDARVILFDRGYSSYPLTHAVGGAHYNLTPGDDSEGPSFAPLSRVDEDAERAWAAEWLVGLAELNNIAIEPRHQEAIHNALLHLAQAPPRDRTLTSLLPLLQSRRLREAVQPYTLSGDYGSLLDAADDSVSTSFLHTFELSGLLEAGPRLATPVLAYLFHRVQRLLTGEPALILVDEAWAFLMHGVFARQIRAWVKEMRKRNAAVVLATQSLVDVDHLQDAQAIYESCPTRIFLPNEEALTPRGKEFYRQLGLNDRQIRLIGHGTKKRDYYWVSPLGRRVIDLELSDVTLSFVGASDEESRRRIRQLISTHGERWPVYWLRERGHDAWATRLEESMVTEKEMTS